MNNECPICFNTVQNCSLICKHSFCYQCIKRWYCQKINNPSCPICRKDMYFKGMYKCKKQLELEQNEIILQQVFEKYLKYILDNPTKFTIFYMKYISIQLFNINSYQCKFSENEIDVLLCYFITPYKQPKSIFYNGRSVKCKISRIRKKYRMKYNNMLYI